MGFDRALSTAELTGHMHRFFDAFCIDFKKFDGALIAQRYAVPYSSLNADGLLQVFATQAQIGQYFQGFLNRYREQGCCSCRCKELHVMALGQKSVLASVTWELLRHDHSVASTWRESYNLTISGSEFLIYASTDHAEMD